MTEELLSKIDETYLLMVDEGYFGGCLYLKIYLDGMFCMIMEVVQALHDSINNFGRSGVAGELYKNITMIVKLLLFVCDKLAKINDLILHVIYYVPKIIMSWL